MKKTRFLCLLLATLTLLLSFGAVASAEKEAPSELTWIASDPGTVRFKVVDYTNQYCIWLYKNNEFVYSSYCYYDEEYEEATGGEIGYLTVNYARYSMAELGDGTYTFKIGAMGDVVGETFEKLAVSEASEPLVYKKPPEVAKADNIKFENNLLTWDWNDSNVGCFEVKLFYTYDGLDFYELHHQETYTNSLEIDESFWEHYHSQTLYWSELNSEKYPLEKARFAAQIYSMPKDRTMHELVATDCFFLTETSNSKEETGEYSKIISLTVGSTLATVNGEVESTDAPPKIVNNRTMLPIRIIAENLGATVNWNAASRTVDIVKGDTSILITIDSATAYVNGKAVPLDVTAFIEHDRTYLPVRFISENLGAKVEWNGDTRTVTIKAN